MVLVRLVKAKGLVREQLLAHSKTGRKKGEPGKGVSMFSESSAMFSYAMTTPSGNSSGGIFFSVLRRPVTVCAVNGH